MKAFFENWQEFSTSDIETHFFLYDVYDQPIAVLVVAEHLITMQIKNPKNLNWFVYPPLKFDQPILEYKKRIEQILIQNGCSKIRSNLNIFL